MEQRTESEPKVSQKCCISFQSSVGPSWLPPNPFREIGFHRRPISTTPLHAHRFLQPPQGPVSRPWKINMLSTPLTFPCTIYNAQPIWAYETLINTPKARQCTSMLCPPSSLEQYESNAHGSAIRRGRTCSLVERDIIAVWLRRIGALEVACCRSFVYLPVTATPHLKEVSPRKNEKYDRDDDAVADVVPRR